MPRPRASLRKKYRYAVLDRIRQLQREIENYSLPEKERKAACRELRELRKLNKWVLE